MAVYEYECKKCSSSFEIRCGIKDSRKNVKCTECGSRRVSQVFGAFTALGLTSKRRGSRSACSGCTTSSCAGCSR